jgi:hypothetical protein
MVARIQQTLELREKTSRILETIFKTLKKPSVGMHTCNLTTREAEAGES